MEPETLPRLVQPKLTPKSRDEETLPRCRVLFADEPLAAMDKAERGALLIHRCAGGTENRKQRVSHQKQQRKYHDGLRTQQSSSDTAPHRFATGPV